MSWIRGEYYTWAGNDDDGNLVIHFNGCEYPMDVFDELVVMRHAELVKKKKVKETELRAIKKYEGNFGCDELREKYGKKTVMGQIRSWSRKRKK